jgi:hypothetical protein
LAPAKPSRSCAPRAEAGQPTGILFGRERWGLTNEEIALADAIVTFPVNPSFASLNIAQAVLLMSYEWISAGLDGSLPARRSLPDLDWTPAPKEQLFGLMHHLEIALEPTGYFRTEDMKPHLVQNLRALLQRPGFTLSEIRVLRGIIAALERRHERGRGRGMAMAEAGPVLVFDSGIGGLSVLKAVRVVLPRNRFVYVADDAAFPYGDWEEEALRDHIVELMGNLIDAHRPAAVVIACNTRQRSCCRRCGPASPCHSSGQCGDQAGSGAD